MVLCASTDGRPIKSVDGGVTFTELGGAPIADGATAVACCCGDGPSLREVYAFAGPPSGAPSSTDAVAYDTTTNAVYVWDGAAWQPAAGGGPGTVDWHVTGNTGTSPLRAGGTDFVGTTDPAGLSIATDGLERVFVEPTGTVKVSPDGTNDRVTVTDHDTTIRHAVGPDAGIVTASDSNVLGFGMPGSAAGYIGGDGYGLTYGLLRPGGSPASGLVAADPGFAAQALVDTWVNPASDQGAARASMTNAAGANGVMSLDVNGASDTSATVLSATSAAGDTAYVRGYADGTADSSQLDMWVTATGGVSVSNLQLQAGVAELLRAYVTDGTSQRLIDITPDSMTIDAGDFASNVQGGTEGDVLSRRGLGGEVRFRPVADILGPGHAEQITGGGPVTVNHGFNVPDLGLGDYPVTVTVIDAASATPVLPLKLAFTTPNTFDIEMPAGTFNVYVSRMFG